MKQEEGEQPPQQQPQPQQQLQQRFPFLPTSMPAAALLVGGSSSSSSSSSRSGINESATRPRGDCVTTPSGKVLRLMQVQAYFRHGARTPCHNPPPRVPHVDWESGECGMLGAFERKLRVLGPNWSQRPFNPFGQRQSLTILPGGCPMGTLTVAGRKDGFQLGRRLRQRYVENLAFLQADYDPSEVYVRSTFYERTIETARLVCSGLFGPAGRHVTLVTLPLEEEHLFPNKYLCPRLGPVMQENMKLHKAALSDETKAFIQQLSTDLGVARDKVYFVGLYDVLVSRKYHNKEIPEHFAKHEEQLQAEAVSEVLARFSHNVQTTMTLAYGPFFTSLLGGFRRTINDEKTEKMKLVCCHDTTIMPLMALLGVPDMEWPPYATDLCFELYKECGSDGDEDKGQEEGQESEDWYVRCLYRGKPFNVANADSEFCPYKDFERMLSPFVPSDYEDACSTKPARKR